MAWQEWSVDERGSPQHGHGDPVLGWNWSEEHPGGNGDTKGGTYTTMSVEEVW